MRAKLSVAAVLVLTVVYAWGLGWIAWGFSRAGGIIGWGLAGAIVVLLVLTVWVTWRELLFGLATARLARRSGDGGPVGGDEPEAEPAGAARAEFDAARHALEHGDQDDWRAWYRLALAYDACRDRRHARESMRRAISLERRS